MRIKIKGLFSGLFRKPDSQAETIAKDIARKVLPVPDEAAELIVDVTAEGVKAATKKKARGKK